MQQTSGVDVGGGGIGVVPVQGDDLAEGGVGQFRTGERDDVGPQLCADGGGTGTVPAALMVDVVTDHADNACADERTHRRFRSATSSA